ncbi:MAG: GreA/GreB family elongation factor [Patescibacteria group bacterium]
MTGEKKFYLTKEGLVKIEKEFNDLKILKLAKISGESPKILHSEDLNQEYLSFQEDLSFIESRLMELEHIFKNVELIKTPVKVKQNIIDLGATVTLEQKDGSINEFTLVGSLEANPAVGKISNESPVGKFLLGHKINDEIIITSPIKVLYKVKKIKYSLS